MSRPVRPPKKVFAISRCRTSNPLIPDVCGVVYTKHYIWRGRLNGENKIFIVDVEITKEEALDLIELFGMTKVLHNCDGTLWETTPTLRSECQRLGLTYTANRRPY